MKKLTRRKSLGLTLIEMMLVLGIFTLIMVGIFQTYAKKQEQAKSEQQILYFQQITEQIQMFLKSTNDFTNFTTANLISSSVIPQEMVKSGAIVNLFGGNVTFTPLTITTTNDSFKTRTDRLSQKACIIIGTSKIAERSAIVRINGTIIKNNGAIFDNASLTAATTSCLNTTTNVVEFDIFTERDVVSLGVGNTLFSNNKLRNKENTKNIPTLGNLVAYGTTPTCTGGTTWNGSFCSCPANTSWDGTTCLPYTAANIGSCPIGQGWSLTTRTCVILANPPGASVPNPGETYSAGRRLPNTFTGGALQQTTPETSSNYT